MLKLDKNYCAIRDTKKISIYEDDLTSKIEKVLVLKNTGKINATQANQIIQHYLSLYLQDEINSTFDVMKQKSNRMLFLRYLNEKVYA